MVYNTEYFLHFPNQSTPLVKTVHKAPKIFQMGHWETLVGRCHLQGWSLGSVVLEALFEARFCTNEPFVQEVKQHLLNGRTPTPELWVGAAECP